MTPRNFCRCRRCLNYLLLSLLLQHQTNLSYHLRNHILYRSHSQYQNITVYHQLLCLAHRTSTINCQTQIIYFPRYFRRYSSCRDYLHQNILYHQTRFVLQHKSHYSLENGLLSQNQLEVLPPALSSRCQATQSQHHNAKSPCQTSHPL